MLPTDNDVAYRAKVRVVEKQFFDILSSPTHMQPLKALARLAGAQKIADIGKTGPVMASVSTSDDVPYRPLHLYETLFGRDSLIVADIVLDYFPTLAESTITMLAALQGTRYDPANEEEPGRIMHEYRDPDSDYTQALIKKNGWAFPYYGSVDATPLFINLLYKYYTQHDTSILDKQLINKDGHIDTIGNALISAINWLIWRLEHSPETILECKTTNPTGIKHQFWKDSSDSYSHKDGTLGNPNGHLSSIEINGITYDALLNSAQFLASLANHTKFSTREPFLIHKKDLVISLAHKLQRTILDRFVKTDSLGIYLALGSERNDNEENIHTFDVISSNMGEVLDSRLLDGDSPQIRQIVEGVTRHLFSDSLLCVSGIRTLSKNERRYHPGAYHNGSVWLWENYIIARGLRRHGYHALAKCLEDTIVRVCDTFKLYPEFVRGDDGNAPTINQWYIKIQHDDTGQVQTIEQPPQQIQAWTVASLVAIQIADHPQVEPTAFEAQLLGRIYHKL